MKNFNKTFKIDGVAVGEGQNTYIIAEMSANHGHDLNKAIELIHSAKEFGANAIKLQTYTADTLTLNYQSQDFYITKGPWKGQYMYDLYKDAYTPWEWHPQLLEEAKKIGITLFSSPFDHSSVDFLSELDMPAYKIASPEIIDIPLIRKVARTGKPLIISTGNATIAQINSALQCVKDEGVRDVALLKCTSTYPAPPEDINLKTIEHMQESFGCSVGLSDHTMGIGVPIASVAFGAKIIEKHLVMDRKDKTADSFFSATPEEFKLLVDNVRNVEKAIGVVHYPLKKKAAQRCLIVIQDIKENEHFTKDNIKSLRPGGGIEPKHFDTIVSHRRASQDIKKGTLLQWEMVLA
ncbi:pseudaminic acid synthase [bacterium]|jgi:pseudaminic acid synthase|nr:pseudaminic acid synthase [bacterium]